MQEDGELVLEAEYDAAQRVVVATLLCYTIFTTEQHTARNFANLHLLIGYALIDAVIVAGKVGTVANVTHHILLQNALGNNPLRIDFHPLHLTGQQRGLCLPGTTDNTHVEQTVVAIGIEMVGRKIDDNMLARLWYRMVQTPARALHIANDALSLFVGSSILQHVLQPVVELILWFNSIQILGNAVVLNLAEDREMIVGRHLFHIDVEETTIADDIAGSLRLFFLIQMVEDARGIDKAVTIALGIAQTSFSEVIVQTGSNMIDVAVTLRKLQLAQQLHITFNVVNKKSLFRETDIAHLMQMG